MDAGLVRLVYCPALGEYSQINSPSLTVTASSGTAESWRELHRVTGADGVDCRGGREYRRVAACGPPDLLEIAGDPRFIDKVTKSHPQFFSDLPPVK